MFFNKKPFNLKRKSKSKSINALIKKTRKLPLVRK